MAHVGRGVGLVGFAARFFRFFDRKGFVALGLQVGDGFLFLVFDAHQRGGEAGDFPFLGHDQRDRLTAEHDLVVIKRTKRLAVFRPDVVLVGFRFGGHARPMLVGQDIENAFDTQRRAYVDARDAALGDRRGDDGAVNESRGVEFAGIFRAAGDFGMAVDARGGGADIGSRGGGHGGHRIFLLDCDCGVAFAACVKARTMTRRARSILKALWA